MSNLLALALTEEDEHGHITIEEIDKIIATADSNAPSIKLPDSIVKCSICHQRFMARINHKANLKAIRRED